VDLNQVSVRPASRALGATPAALLAGTDIDKDFELKALPARDGLDWVQATPRKAQAAGESTVKQVQIGFRGKALAALEITDAFGTRSVLQFKDLAINAKLADDVFRFTPPAGADVIEQP
jgi:outer membrane lipoprotein carrier protein